ncbi:twin-arginine translocase subunit TatC [Phascolarctobacterium sp.]
MSVSDDYEMKEMTLTEHLGELRSRLLKSLAALTMCTVISWAFIDGIMAFLTAPAENLYYMRPAEAFFIYLKVALAAGMLLASPILFYQLWAFLVPAFSNQERKILLPFVVFSVLLFWSGILFSYYFVFPQGLSFFTTFAGARVVPLLSIESYLDFFLMLVLPFGFIFDLPMALITLAVMGVIRSRQLLRGRRYMILAAFILAGIITPTPDVVTQTLLAVPMIILYEGSRLFIRYILKK